MAEKPEAFVFEHQQTDNGDGGPLKKIDTVHGDEAVKVLASYDGMKAGARKRRRSCAGRLTASCSRSFA